MVHVKNIVMKETKICVIGLGYVGLPLARFVFNKVYNDWL